MLNLKDEIKRILAGVNPEWSDLEKTRYVYIEVGKIVEKNTEFFLTQEGKLENLALSNEEMEKIHDAGDNIFDYKEWYRIICKSGGVLIKTILDELNIPSHLVKTVRYTNLSPTSNKKVHHWFLSVDIDDTHYFLTIAGDLHNIKNNFATEHFATEIEYRDPKGNQMYDGEELEFTELTYEQLLEIDKKIGYANTLFKYKKSNNSNIGYYDEALRTINNTLNRDNKWYHEVLIYDLPIYKNMFTVVDGNGTTSNITSLDNKTIFLYYHEQLIKNVCLEVEKNLKESLGINIPTFRFTSYQDWLINICNLLQSDLIDTYGEEFEEYIKIPDNFDFKIWRQRQKKNLTCPYVFYDDYLLLLDEVNSYVQMISMLHNAYKEETIDPNIINKIKNVRMLHAKISEHFLPDIAIFEKNLEVVNNMPYVKSNYINEKFKTMFPLIFNIDNGPQDFNSFGYSEQIATINKLIQKMFGELTEDNCSQAPGYTFYCRPALNRIRPYALFNKETNSYEIIFHIRSFFDFEDEFYYKYELKENKFSQVDIIEDVYKQKKYEIISVTLRRNLDKMNDKNTNYSESIDEIEDIEHNKTR